MFVYVQIQFRISDDNETDQSQSRFSPTQVSLSPFTSLVGPCVLEPPPPPPPQVLLVSNPRKTKAHFVLEEK